MMDGFLRTATNICALLFLLTLATGLSFLFLLKSKGVIGPQQFRDMVLTEEERAWLEGMRTRPPEPAHRPVEVVPNVPGGASEREIVERIAERVNSDRATELIEDLRRRTASLDERDAHLERTRTEQDLARAELARLRRQLDEQDLALKEEAKRLAEERTRWAMAQADAVTRTEALRDAELERYRAQVRIYEQMKDAAWQSLRKFEVREIARYLKLMEPKKAARMLTLAEQDKDLNGIATQIQKAMLSIDLEAPSQDLVAHLATLYSFMKGDQVASYLSDSSPERIVSILTAMSQQPKKQAEIITSLRIADADRAAQVERLMTKPNR